MAEEEIYKGSCLCGQVSFEARGASEGNIACYCMQCQKNSGSTHQIAATFPQANMTVSDPNNSIKIFNVPAEMCSSGLPKEKVFCGNCGCTLWTIPAKLKGRARYVRTSLIVGGLTHEKLQPNEVIYKTT